MTVFTVGVVAAVATAGLAAPVVTAPALSGMVAGSASAASAAAATATATATAGAGTAAGAAGSTAVIASGPVGWIVLGAEDWGLQHHWEVGGFTFDCWKPVVRDNSTQLSSGKLLKEILEDQRIKEIIVHESRNSWNLPELRLVNIWEERFDINYLVLPTNNQLVAHAVRVS
ncbi:uncharacterized protein LOC124197382 [Daphnia pulex]|uniref:uncharacterized protein LOC124197382 n=1 Tax=Daphnia pulex TaxID=6669 RepID=UPI001EDF5AA7|nr:uncharacterized protein LOC124197382 [Daphnia pulex]